MWSYHSSFFFFQAEDGIRDLTVTGVQTCALPICSERFPVGEREPLGERDDAEAEADRCEDSRRIRQNVLGGAAADIEGDQGPGEALETGPHAPKHEPRFLLAAHHLDAPARRALDRGDERPPVRRVALDAWELTSP